MSTYHFQVHITLSNAVILLSGTGGGSVVVSGESWLSRCEADKVDTELQDLYRIYVLGKRGSEEFKLAINRVYLAQQEYNLRGN